MNLWLSILSGILMVVYGQPYFSILSPEDLAEKFGQERVNLIEQSQKMRPMLIMEITRKMSTRGCYTTRSATVWDAINTRKLGSMRVEIAFAWSKGKQSLSDRGKCHFVTKTRHAQKAGCDILVVYDNNPLQTATAIVLADDGTGDDISIPTVMISASQGELIKDYFGGRIKSGMVEVRVSLREKVVQLEKVRIDIFLDPLVEEMLKILVELAGLFEKCKNKMEFVLHLQSESCDYCSDSFKSKNCYCGGKYCLFKGHQRVRGCAALDEELTQYCLYYGFGIDKLFKYIVGLDNIGFDLDNKDEKALILSSAGVSPEGIQKCITKSFNGQSRDECESNTIFEKEREEKSRFIDIPYRSILINYELYTGLMTPKEVRDAIVEKLGDPEDC